MSKWSLRGKTKKFVAKSASLIFGLSMVVTSSAPQAAIGQKIDAQGEAKVNKLISQMTLEEKVKMLSGTSDQMHVPGLERLGIPELKFSDGPVGVRCWGKATAYPVGAMLASTWDENQAFAYGKSLGRDSRARAVHVLLAPGMDLYRVAQCGRNFEYLGEDPFLVSKMAVAYCKGVQSERVAVSAKHYAANDQEIQRDSINTIVDERRLHEICFPPFKACVQEAGAWTLMAAYNKVNGDWCTASKYLLTDVLRNQWGFKGVLMSDWGAVHDSLGPLTAGTDLEMGSNTHYTLDNIKRLLAEGKITQDVVDEHVRRILRMSVAMGWFDNKQEDKSIPLEDPESEKVALETARKGLVLLRNQNDLLPLNKNTVKNVVVIGPNATPGVIGGGGSSGTVPFKSTTLLDAVINSAGKSVNVTYIPNWIGANPTATSAFNCGSLFEPLDNGLRGVKAEYFANADLSGTPKVVQTDRSINFWWGTWHPVDEIKQQNYSVRWTGKLKAPQSDNYTFAIVSDGARISMDGKIIFDNFGDGTQKNSSFTIPMRAGEAHDLLVEYKHTAGSSIMQFNWGRSSEAFTQEQAKLIADADAVIASVGMNPFLETEGLDRPYDLPGDQLDLLKSVTKLNPKTVVVLNAGGNVGMESWIDNVAGLMHAWYPGQNGNIAVAEAIFGDINPSGKLPDTFEKKFEDSPAFGNYPGNPANGGTLEYKEGIYVGYRWADKKNVAPRYPFGFGLSYTTFAMNNLKLSKVGNNVTATVDVTNTGKRAGADVVQAYVRPINSTLDRPVQELKAFSRVELQPGESKTVSMTLTPDAIAVYDDKAHAWTYPAGQYEVAIGESSRDIRTSQTVKWDSRQVASKNASGWTIY